MAGVFGGAVVVVEVELGMDLLVEGEDITGAERLVNVTGVVKGFVVAVAVVVDFNVMLVEGPDVEVESELALTE